MYMCMYLLQWLCVMADLQYNAFVVSQPEVNVIEYFNIRVELSSTQHSLTLTSGHERYIVNSMLLQVSIAVVGSKEVLLVQ